LSSFLKVFNDIELDSLYDEKWPVIVKVRTKDGQLLSARRDIMKGEPEAWVADEELKEKFYALASDAVSTDRAEQQWQGIFRLEKFTACLN